jgi:hypothetical protein
LIHLAADLKDLIQQLIDDNYLTKVSRKTFTTAQDRVFAKEDEDVKNTSSVTLMYAKKSRINSANASVVRFDEDRSVGQV